MSLKLLILIILGFLALYLPFNLAEKPSTTNAAVLATMYMNLYKHAKGCFSRTRELLGLSTSIRTPDQVKLSKAMDDVEAFVDDIARAIHGNVGSIDRQKAFEYLDKLGPTFPNLKKTLAPLMTNAKFKDTQKKNVNDKLHECDKDAQKIGKDIRHRYDNPVLPIDPLKVKLI